MTRYIIGINEETERLYLVESGYGIELNRDEFEKLNEKFSSFSFSDFYNNSSKKALEGLRNFLMRLRNADSIATTIEIFRQLMSVSFISVDLIEELLTHETAINEHFLIDPINPDKLIGFLNYTGMLIDFFKSRFPNYDQMMLDEDENGEFIEQIQEFVTTLFYSFDCIEKDFYEAFEIITFIFKVMSEEIKDNDVLLDAIKNLLAVDDVKVRLTPQRLIFLAENIEEINIIASQIQDHVNLYQVINEIENDLLNMESIRLVPDILNHILHTNPENIQERVTRGIIQHQIRMILEEDDMNIEKLIILAKNLEETIEVANQANPRITQELLKLFIENFEEIATTINQVKVRIIPQRLIFFAENLKEINEIANQVQDQVNLYQIIHNIEDELLDIELIRSVPKVVNYLSSTHSENLQRETTRELRNFAMRHQNQMTHEARLRASRSESSNTKLRSF